ncbi:phage holin family protein [Conexibacter stalactiti]|uniref:Phage holin family protein n=1 Tax=Conexibacter stalactiti TaxID=1940611 RepID=A0ABU4HY86_9ACTN|nr:phage holin family protein [Conexibacter stalactiti]MDW5598292.1 phage holin family protein [Conexibacter stalactiti]MEC5038934.1 phage holin family protein [Conexibacter stalactiti]
MRNGSLHRIGRLASVTLLDAILLLLLAAVLPGFSADGFGAALALAVLLGLANALVWPLMIRFALPFTVLTLGLGALVLNGLVLLAIAEIDYGVHVRGLGSAIVVTLALTVLSAVSNAILALDNGDLWYRHVVIRQLKRTKLAVESETPGLLFLEIDGLAHEVLRRALRDGNAPALAHWVHDGSHRLERWETDWSSQTGACQAGILHGDNHDMPAFRWWEKDRGKAIVTNHPRDAAELERRHSDGRGLLHADGASRANILSGDAPHSMLTMSTVLDRKRQGRLGQDYFAYFASPYGVALTFMRCLGEIVSEKASAIQQKRRDVRPRIDRGGSYPLMRAFGTVIQLDLQVAAVTADVLAGRPVVYTTFLAYDEVAHHSGVERPDTLAVLRRVDRAIARIASAVEHAPRPYELVVLADHGQSQGATFLQRYDESLEQLVRRVVENGEAKVAAATAESDESRGQLRAGIAELGTRPGVTGRAAKALADRQEKAQLPPGEEPPEIAVMASGNLGLISFPREQGRVTLEQIEQRRPGLLDELRNHDGIGFVLVRSERDGAVALGPRGRHLLDRGVVEGEDPLAPFGPRAADHVRRTDGFSHCPDIVVNSRYWSAVDEVAAFEELVGSHGGLGGAQALPFVLHPASLLWPDGDQVVGSGTVHRIFCGWLHQLGHDGYEPFRPDAEDPAFK